jgi:hypothetical protein
MFRASESARGRLRLHKLRMINFGKMGPNFLEAPSRFDPQQIISYEAWARRSKDERSRIMKGNKLYTHVSSDYILRHLIG